MVGASARDVSADADYVAEVRELCRLAGVPHFANWFIETETPIEAVLDCTTQIAIGFRSRHRQARAIAPFSDLFLGNGGFAGSDL